MLYGDNGNLRRYEWLGFLGKYRRRPSGWGDALTISGFVLPFPFWTCQSIYILMFLFRFNLYMAREGKRRRALGSCMYRHERLNFFILYILHLLYILVRSP